MIGDCCKQNSASADLRDKPYVQWRRGRAKYYVPHSDAVHLLIAGPWCTPVHSRLHSSLRSGALELQQNKEPWAIRNRSATASDVKSILGHGGYHPDTAVTSHGKA